MTIIHPDCCFDILCAATALPDSKAVSNIDILQHFPRTANKSDEFYHKMDSMIRQDIGFCERYLTHKPWEPLPRAKETSESLALKAVSHVFSQCNPKELQLFLLGSTTNKRYSGSQAAAVPGAYGLNVPAYDLKAGCSTSLATLHLTYALLCMGYDNAVVACAETMSTIMDPENEKTWLGVADGAAALWLQKNEIGQFKVEKSFFSSEGQFVDAYTTRGTLPPTHEELDSVGYFLKGDETLLKELAESRYRAMLDKFLPSAVERAEVTWIISHQVNRRLIENLIKEYQLEKAVLFWDADKIGNIGGTSVLYTLAKAVKAGAFNRNGKLLMMSVGGGLSCAAQLLSVRSQHEPD